MRSILLACLLAGCYQPTTESCYYRCATGANPCPSGLECSAGMCATPGTNCSATGDGAGSDAVSDSLPGIDAPASLCGDGMTAVGEICYGTPITINTGGTTAPVDGVLGDYDGDGDLDVMYLQTGNAGGVRAHLQALGSFGANVSGPSLVNPTFLRTANLNPVTPAIELIIGTDTGIVTFGYSSGAPMMISSLNDTTVGATAVVANVTNGPITDVVTLGTNLTVYRYDATLILARVGSTAAGVLGAQEVAASRLNADGFGDVAIGGPAGITTYSGGTSGAANPLAANAGTGISDVDIGDINGGSPNDLVFVVNDTGPGMPGKIGVMIGMGDGTFAAPLVTPVVNLGNSLALRDLDGDNLQDVIVVRTGANRSLLIFRGRSDGLLEPAVAFTLPGTSAQVSVRGDYNNDTVPDIVVTDRLSRSIYVYPSNP